MLRSAGYRATRNIRCTSICDIASTSQLRAKSGHSVKWFKSKIPEALRNAFQTRWRPRADHFYLARAVKTGSGRPFMPT
jgi:hypothetical protein